MQQPVTFEAEWDPHLAEHTGTDEIPFAPAVISSGRTVWLSGATAFPLTQRESATSDISADIGEQTRHCLANVRTVLEAAGGTVLDIVKVTIFNTDMDQQDRVNAVYLDFFGNHRPARSHIGVHRLTSPELKIEIEAVAVVD